MTKGVDFSEFNKFIKDFQVAREDFESFLKKILLEMAERVLEKAKERTPVDTGALRADWQIGSIKGEGTNLSVEILNSREYASHVEFGHATRNDGWVDGRFMLTISMDEVENQMDTKFKKAFQQWVKEKGIGE